ncbi:MAG: hypothetical protein ACOYNC_14350 [Bacteroidales bacterium]
MKKACITIMTGFILLYAGQISAQKLKSGDLTALKGQKTINISYDYSKMEVGKFKTEEEYVNKGTEERNKKKPGTGDEWAARWNSGKIAKYQPAYEESFNKQAEECGIVGKADPTATYTMIIHTNALEVGVETVVMGSAKSAAVELVVDIAETAAPEKIIATIEMEAKPKSNMRMSVGGVPVNKEVYDPTLRVAECYETAGKQIGKMICKELK